RQQTQRASATGKPPESAYVLLLVRPDGITTYYHTLEVLKALQIEFGYEFIDREWNLVFPEGDSAPPRQPWMIAEKQEIAPGSGVARKVKGWPAPQAETPVERPRGVVSNGDRPALVSGGGPYQGQEQPGQTLSSSVGHTPLSGELATRGSDGLGQP